MRRWLSHLVQSQQTRKSKSPCHTRRHTANKILPLCIYASSPSLEVHQATSIPVYLLVRKMEKNGGKRRSEQHRSPKSLDCNAKVSHYMHSARYNQGVRDLWKSAAVVERAFLRDCEVRSCTLEAKPDEQQGKELDQRNTDLRRAHPEA